jgi:hypothetical protein
MYNYYIIYDNCGNQRLVRKLEEVVGGDEIVQMVYLKDERILVVTKEELTTSVGRDIVSAMSKFNGDLDEDN